MSSYRADGVKVKKVHHYFFGRGKTDALATTEYINGFQYQEDTGNIGSISGLQFFATSEGYYDFANNRYIYHYNDHLGNVRVSFAREGNMPVIVQQNNYYAFGLKHSGGLSGNGSYKYEYNGKELQEELGMYDYGARFYMPDLGRWGVVDPLAEVTPHLSPYHYANNNPIMFNDPTGMLSQSFIDAMWNSSPDGATTTWYNTGSGFQSSDGVSIGYKGNYASLNAYIDAGGSSGGGGDKLPIIDIPGVTFNGVGSSHNWNIGDNYLNNIISMGTAIRHSSFFWTLEHGAIVYDHLSGVRNDGPIKMIGGTGDPIGLLDVAGQVISNWEPENQGLAMVAGVIGAVALKKPGLAVKSEYYSVAYEMKLAKSSYPGVYRGGHFREANKALEAAIKSDARFASPMENLGIFIPKSPTGSILGKSPANWVWHHHIDEGIMQLVPKSQHTVGSSFWKTMHPGNKGGFYFWGK
ncbi:MULTISPECIES: RHS repeat-associated core domain-containing protein [Chryseobacterium]|uniref:RHS repeat-associated core domain n=1 Tax=Chryseobacterium taihuense TaxID=1141221 RepID=A0A4U8WF11_9FLAO|nr:MULTISPECIES: RHS repeat-associated core domain-containing protein [Chryseobacterium]QQV03153.1 HNH endonuclease [Chryseobacterium sp. FDAARGOS 1104]VFB03545.1 RHS repeat-associated core domain [Chryseobacterium taihuense]